VYHRKEKKENSPSKMGAGEFLYVKKKNSKALPPIRATWKKGEGGSPEIRKKRRNESIKESRKKEKGEDRREVFLSCVPKKRTGGVKKDHIPKNQSSPATKPR